MPLKKYIMTKTDGKYLLLHLIKYTLCSVKRRINFEFSIKWKKMLLIFPLIKCNAGCHLWAKKCSYIAQHWFPRFYLSLWSFSLCHMLLYHYIETGLAIIKFHIYSVGIAGTWLSRCASAWATGSESWSCSRCPRRRQTHKSNKFTAT
jgi:hypothetical protein